jgi:hypothetical protein
MIHGRSLIVRFFMALGNRAATRLLWYFGVFLLFFSLSGLRLLMPASDPALATVLSAMAAAVVSFVIHIYVFPSPSRKR